MKDKFDKDFGERKGIETRYKDSAELQREILYQMYKSNHIAERTRRNTNTLVIWLVALPVIIGILYFVIRGVLDS